MAFAFVACTEKEKIEPNNGGGTTNPPAPQHNSLYQTRWVGTAEQTLTVPIFGDVTFTLENNVEFQTDTTAQSLIHVTAGNIISRDTNVACTYTWNDPDGVLTAVKNPQMSIAFHKTSADTINITIYKRLLEIANLAMHILLQRTCFVRCQRITITKFISNFLQ